MAASFTPLQPALGIAHGELGLCAAAQPWKPMKVTELFNKAILLPMFVYGDCISVCLILYTCQQPVWLKYPNPLI
jgi:hypothetical protein